MAKTLGQHSDFYRHIPISWLLSPMSCIPRQIHEVVGLELVLDFQVRRLSGNDTKPVSPVPVTPATNGTVPNSSRAPEDAQIFTNTRLFLSDMNRFNRQAHAHTHIRTQARGIQAYRHAYMRTCIHAYMHTNNITLQCNSIHSTIRCDTMPYHTIPYMHT